MVTVTLFKQDFKGDIVEPTSVDYPAAIARWAVNSQRKARYVVFPKDAGDISLALEFATSNNIPFSVKCGGHNPSGVSSVKDGVCIDLSRYFNTARVDPEQQLVYVGGGAVWGTVDNATIAHGLATPGGTVNHTGVGGLTLGGGYGWLSGQYGLVIDNLVQATVVIANGSVVVASPTSHPDLFWAIRGGGSNFGIVTEFVLKAYPQRKTVFAGPVIFPPPLIGKVAEAVDKWWAGVGDKEGLMVSLTRGPDRQPAVILILFFNGSEEEGRANFKQFYDIGPVADFAREMPYGQLNSMLNENVGFGRRFYMACDSWGGTSLRSRLLSNAQEMFDRVVMMSANHPKQPTLPPFDIMVGYEFIPLKKVCSVPPDATAFRSRGPQPNIVLLISWDQEEEGEDVHHARAFAQELGKIIDATQERQLQEHENYEYSNYVSDPSPNLNKAQKLWGENYPKLQKIKKEYDPKAVFNQWFPIQPAA
ncbi:hypothetical protein JB92DRAFT_2832474 [Gautieria morchelliformis]|nr:hypothetical protein JB92DRAFT_2832474 [Gautieria morchelliformis]